MVKPKKKTPTWLAKSRNRELKEKKKNKTAGNVALHHPIRQLKKKNSRTDSRNRHNALTGFYNPDTRNPLALPHDIRVGVFLYSDLHGLQ